MNKQENNLKKSMPNQQMPSIAGLEKPGGGAGKRFMRPIEKPKDFRKTMKRLWGFLRGSHLTLMGITAAVLVSSAMTLLVPYLIGRAVDMLSLSGQPAFLTRLGRVAGVLLAVYAVDAAAHLLQGWMMAEISRDLVVKLRDSLFEKLQKLPTAFFDTRTHGEIMSRLTNDIDNVSTTISQSGTQLISGVLTIAGAFLMMLYLSPLLTFASLITVPLVFLLSKSIAKKTKTYFKSQQQELGRLNGCIEETITGLHVVKAFNREEKVIEAFEKINHKLFTSGLKAQIFSGFLMPMMNVINNLGFVVVAAAGGMLAVKDIITVGVIASFLSYSRQFSRPLNDMANVFNTLQSAVAGAERVFEVLDEKEEIEDQQGALVLKKAKGDVVFKNVSFCYRPDVKVLKDISFHVKAGSRIAFVGETGSGKTTIVNLLSRFYEVSSGEILIDGYNIKDYTRSSLRNCFGIVLQDTYLFTGTIKENIKYGNLQASDEAVIRAAKIANADSFIKKLPKGYETMLTESGSNLSEGERQLLAIARAVLSDSPILILDEATSSVDTRTELQIQEAMLKLMEGRTSFIIAHRLSTIRDVDCIMVINEGEIVEKGSHDELIALKGSYYKLYQ